MSHSDSNETRSDDAETGTRTAGAFDIRVIIGALLGIYGVVLLLTDLVGNPEARVDRANDIDLNLWTGLALLVASAIFVLWARLRPIVLKESAEEPPEAV